VHSKVLGPLDRNWIDNLLVAIGMVLDNWLVTHDITSFHLEL
jgi:hypothetical protein